MRTMHATDTHAPFAAKADSYRRLAAHLPGPAAVAAKRMAAMYELRAAIVEPEMVAAAA